MQKSMLVVALALLAQGCGAAAPQSHCDFRASEKPPRCQEYENVPSQVPLAVCEVVGGKAGDGPCPRENLVAGCRHSGTGPMIVTDWLYLHEGEESDTVRTRDDVGRECADDETLVDP